MILALRANCLGPLRGGIAWVGGMMLGASPAAASTGRLRGRLRRGLRDFSFSQHVLSGVGLATHRLVDGIISFLPLPFAADLAEESTNCHDVLQ